MEGGNVDREEFLEPSNELSNCEEDVDEFESPRDEELET